MNTVLIVLLVILVIVIIGVVVLYFVGRHLEKRQDEQQETIDANAQVVNMLIIDKKKLKFRDAGFSDVIIDQIPKYLRRSKVPIVKAKVGPRIQTLLCDPMIYDQVPLKKEVKATVSGMYITAVRGAHGVLEPPPKKEGFFKRHFGRHKDEEEQTAGQKQKAKG